MKVQVIIGSTRPGRVGPQIAQWIVKNLPQPSRVTYEIVDLVDHTLPFFNEPHHPAMNSYSHDHTRKWSKKIKEADAYIFLTPEYNDGYPAVLKNAIDYLFHEWTAKPAMVVSYGVHGGTGASAQLRQVVTRLKMLPTATSPALTVSRDMSDEDGRIKDIDELFRPFKVELVKATEELLDGLAKSAAETARRKALI